MSSKMPSAPNRKASRVERLTAALRENLKRRKAQQRVRNGAAKDGGGNGPETAPEGETRS